MRRISQMEWIPAKEYIYQIGKLGKMIKMINPKTREGSTTCPVYPTEPGEPIQYARNISEEKEATKQTHRKWMKNLKGEVNLHYVEKVYD